GGGGGHSSGGGGGRSGGGGFSGGHSSVGFSGTRGSAGVRSGNTAVRSGFSGARGGVGMRSGNNAVRSGFGARAGAVAPRGYVRSVGVAGSRNFAVRGAAPRGTVYGHSYAGGGAYARPYGWGRHSGYFYSHGYYGSLYYPWLGLGYGFLPYGYYPFWWGDAYYYYSGGLFYQYENDQYTVVEPPVGAEVKSLPEKAQSIVIDGQQYYEMNGVYYQPVTKEDGTVTYQVAGKDGELNTGANGAAAVTPKVGDITQALPPDCKKVKLNGNTLYVSDDGIYYQEVTDANGNKAYKIVALESDNSGN
ncbi:MAG: DUF6515 family protein, partial [Sphingobacteriales bacterium]